MDLQVKKLKVDTFIHVLFPSKTFPRALITPPDIIPSPPQAAFFWKSVPPAES